MTSPLRELLDELPDRGVVWSFEYGVVVNSDPPVIHRGIFKFTALDLGTGGVLSISQGGAWLRSSAGNRQTYEEGSLLAKFNALIANPVEDQTFRPESIRTTFPVSLLIRVRNEPEAATNVQSLPGGGFRFDFNAGASGLQVQGGSYQVTVEVDDRGWVQGWQNQHGELRLEPVQEFQAFPSVALAPTQSDARIVWSGGFEPNASLSNFSSVRRIVEGVLSDDVAIERTEGLPPLLHAFQLDGEPTGPVMAQGVLETGGGAVSPGLVGLGLLLVLLGGIGWWRTRR